MESCPVELGWWDYINLGPGRRQMAHLRVNWREFNKQIFYKVVDWAEWTNKRWWSFWKLCTGRSHQLPWWWKVWEEWHPWTWQALPNWWPSSGLLGNCPLSLPVLQLSCRCLRWPPTGRAKSTWGCSLPRQTHETQNRTDRENGNRKTKERDQFTLQLLPSTEGDLVWLRVVWISHVAVLLRRWIARWWQWCYPWFILVSSWFIFSLEEYPMHVVPVSVHAAGFPLSVMTVLVVLNTWPGVSEPWTSWGDSTSPWFDLQRVCMQSDLYFAVATWRHLLSFNETGFQDMPKTFKKHFFFLF